MYSKNFKNNKSRNREIVYGINAVEQVLVSSPETILSAWYVSGRETDERIAKIIATLKQYGVVAQNSRRATVETMAEGGVHQGIVLEIKPMPLLNEHDLQDKLDSLKEEGVEPFLLVLDNVTDPRNLGAAMRSVWAAGAHAVIVPKDKSAQFSPAARKAASGAASAVPLYVVTNLARVLDDLDDREFKIVGMDGEAENDIYSTDFTGPLAIVMGSEESGMRRLTREKCTAITKIPMAHGVESLNVSVAAGIALFEAVRQRGLTK